MMFKCLFSIVMHDDFQKYFSIKKERNKCLEEGAIMDRRRDS